MTMRITARVSLESLASRRYTRKTFGLATTSAVRRLSLGSGSATMHGSGEPDTAQRGGQHVRDLAAAQGDIGLRGARLQPLRLRRSRQVRIEADDIVFAEIVGVPRVSPSLEVSFGAVESPARFAELSRDELFVGDRPDAHGQISLSLP
jgi:hypothetical protein